MQITQERLEYDLMTNYMKFMQQTTSTVSEGDTSVCNYYQLQSTHLLNSPKVTASAENADL